MNILRFDNLKEQISDQIHRVYFGFEFSNSQAESYICNDDLEGLFDYLYSMKNDDENNSIRSDISEKFKASFSNVDVQLYRDNRLTPIFEFFSPVFIKDSIQSWPENDILLFSSHVKEKYNIGNAKKYFTSDVEHMKDVQQFLLDVISKGGIDQYRVGCLTTLHKTLKIIIDNLEESTDNPSVE